ncbi:MAG: MATE family efflux transporter [Culicoidibacterales bacterium]
MDIINDNVKKLIFKIGFPAMIGMFFVTMFNFTDTFFASKIVGVDGKVISDALAGVAASFPLFMVLNALSGGLSSATGVLVGEQLGKKDIEKAQEIMFHTILVAVVSGVVVGLGMITIAPLLFKLLHLESGKGFYATRYITVLMACAPVFSLSGVIGQLLNVQGLTKKVRNSLIIGFFANILFDYLLITVIPLDVVGLAIATVTVQFIQVLYIYFHLLKSNLGKGFNKRYQLNFDYVKSLFRLAIPSGFSMIIVSVGIFLLNRYAQDLDPVSGVSAVGIGFRVEQMFLILLFGGLGPAMMAIGSQALGAKKLDRLKELYKLSLIIGLLTLSFASVVLYFGAPFFAELFAERQSSLYYATIRYLQIEAFTMPAYALLTIPGNMVTILKKPSIPMWINISRQLVAPLFLYSYTISLSFTPSTLWWTIFANNWFHGLFALMLVTIIFKKELQKI